MFKTVAGVLRIETYSCCISEHRVNSCQFLLVCISSLIIPISSLRIHTGPSPSRRLGWEGRDPLCLPQPVALVLVSHDKVPTFSHKVGHQVRVDIRHEAGQGRPVVREDGVGLPDIEETECSLHPS